MFKNAEIVGENVSYATYAAQTEERGEEDFIMSRSELSAFDYCPARWIAGHREKQSEEMAWGSLIDCLVLTPHRVEELFAVYPETYPTEKEGEKPWNNNATYCKNWKKEHSGKSFLKASELTEAKQAVNALRSDEDAHALIGCSKKQVMAMAEWHDKATKLVVPVKVLIDLVPDKSREKFGKSLADLKTDSCADPNVWAKSVFNRGYDTQAALYLDVYLAATNEDRVDFRHVIQENFFPWQTARRILSQEYIDVGRARYQSALKFYCYCLSRNEWPDYEGRGRTVLEGWTLAEPEAWMLDRTNNNWSMQALAKQSEEAFFAQH